MVVIDNKSTNRYSAYFDESGTHDNSEAVVVAGCVASNQQWQEFDRTWREVLSDAEINHFHMRDFAHSLREFKDWKNDEQRRTRFLKLLVETMRRNIRRSFSSSVVIRDYERINTRYQLSEFSSPYVICALTCVVDVAKWCNAHGYSESVECVFEDGVKNKGEFLRFYVPSNFHKITYAKKHDFVAFQAADLIAWEVLKLHKQLSSGALKKRRNSFLALYSIPNDWGVYESTHLESFCRNFHVPLRT